MSQKIYFKFLLTLRFQNDTLREQFISLKEHLLTVSVTMLNILKNHILFVPKQIDGELLPQNLRHTVKHVCQI